MTTEVVEAPSVPRLKERYRTEIAPALQGRVRVRQRDADPGADQDRREHGRRRGGQGRQADRRRGPRPGHDHRAEAGRGAGQEVHRPVQAARGHADRRARHAARRPDVGVPRPAAGHRAAPDPRLPRPVRPAVRRARELHLRPDRAGHVPRDRPGQGGPAARDGHHRRHHGHQRRRRPRAAAAARLPVQGRRREAEWRRRRWSSRRTATPKFQVRGYTRCTRCGRPRAVYRKFGLCRICFRTMAHRGELPGITKSSW